MKLLGTLVYRAMGAAVLDASVYEGIEADPAATRQALAVVLLASVSAGIGASGWAGPEWETIGIFGLLALVTWIAYVRGYPALPPMTTFLHYLPNYIAAMVAIVPSQLFHRLGRRLYRVSAHRRPGTRL